MYPVRKLCLSLVATIFWVPSAVQGAAITGTVLQATRERNALSVPVHARDGTLVESPTVTKNGSVLFSLLPEQKDGVFLLNIYGDADYEYTPILLLLKNGAIASSFPRKDPLLIPPREDEPWPSETEIVFQPRRKANYARKPAPWRLRDLWRYKFQVLQLLAIAFVVWFPQVIRDLPKDLREELMGEKEEDIGDSNAVLKALLGYDNVDKSAQPRKQT